METIELQYPIEVNGERVARLNLRRVTVGDLEVMNREADDLGKAIRLLSLISDLSPEDVRRLDAADFNRASEAVSAFLG